MTGFSGLIRKSISGDDRINFQRLEGDYTIRRPHRAPPPVKDGTRVNEDIRSSQVQLIDQDGKNHGDIDTQTALEMAYDAGLDLVEISPNSRPPVVKILDYGKHKYQAQKKAAEARKKQKTVDVKEIKMRPGIDTHDYEVKMRNARRFLEDEDKVKVTMRFRGREMAHQDLGLDVLYKVRDELAEISKMEFAPKSEGRQMTMILAPVPAGKKPVQKMGKVETPEEDKPAEPDQTEAGA